METRLDLDLKEGPTVVLSQSLRGGSEDDNTRKQAENHQVFPTTAGQKTAQTSPAPEEEVYGVSSISI